MRSLKSALIMAGKLKYKPEVDDEIDAVILALCTCNVPKFTDDDLRLFKAMLYDVFPGVQIP